MDKEPRYTQRRLPGKNLPRSKRIANCNGLKSLTAAYLILIIIIITNIFKTSSAVCIKYQ